VNRVIYARISVILPSWHEINNSAICFFIVFLSSITTKKLKIQILFSCYIWRRTEFVLLKAPNWIIVLSFNVLLRKGFTHTIHIIASLKEHLFDYCIALLLFFWKGFNQFMHCINQFIWWYHCTFSYWLMPWVCFVRIMLCCFIHL
jgi:hypothetical protein